MLPKLACLAVMGVLLVPAPSAMAQLYGDPFGGLRDGYGQRGAPPVYRDQRRYDRNYERRDYRYDDVRRGGRGGRFSDFCSTGRGPCRTAPQPIGTRCRCDIDGLTKRGIIQ